MGLVIAVALVAAMIIAQWSKPREVIVATAPVFVDAPGAESAAPAMPLEPARPSVSTIVVAPTAEAIATCGRYAGSRIGPKDAAAPDDLDEAIKRDERYRRAYASCMRSRGHMR
jgi:hypothetical protein